MRGIAMAIILAAMCFTTGHEPNDGAPIAAWWFIFTVFVIVMGK